MIVEEVTTKLKTAIDTVPNLRSVVNVSDAKNLPSGGYLAFIMLDSIEPNNTMTLDTYRFDILVVLGRANTRVTVDMYYKIIDRDSDTSIRAALLDSEDLSDYGLIIDNIGPLASISFGNTEQYIGFEMSLTLIA